MIARKFVKPYLVSSAPSEINLIMPWSAPNLRGVLYKIGFQNNLPVGTFELRIWKWNGTEYVQAYSINLDSEDGTKCKKFDIAHATFGPLKFQLIVPASCVGFNFGYTDISVYASDTDLAL